MRRVLVLFVIAAAAAWPAAAQSYPSHVAVSLTRIPGNTCCPKYTRASVSATGVLTQSRMARGGAWTRVGRRRLTPAELSRLRTELRRFNPATLVPNRSAGCGGPPIGDVGGEDLKVGSHESNCPPPAASRLIKLLSRWLPAA